MTRTALYRLYAADGTLLYVGVTGKLSVRFYYHSREKRWWPQVYGKRITWYDQRAEAEEAERCAILGENPVHNVFHTPAQGEVIRAAQRRTHSGGLLGGEPLLFGGESEAVRAHYRKLIERQLAAGA